MISTIIGKKLGQTQGFLEDGRRIPLTRIDVSSNVVVQLKSQEKEGYNAVQLGFGSTKKADKPTAGHTKKAGLNDSPRVFREAKVEKVDGIEIGSKVVVEEILAAGDIVDVSGVSKGKGYAGVVKRHHFKGGPKTHGQSDRLRAPGSIGQSTTPGRVYKGKRMAGRMGVDRVTIKNLEVIDYTEGVLLVKGLVPGPISSFVTITRSGTNKKHIGLFKAPVVEEEILESKVEEIGSSVEEQEAERVEAVEAAKEEESAIVEEAKDEVKSEEAAEASTLDSAQEEIKEESADEAEKKEEQK